MLKSSTIRFFLLVVLFNGIALACSPLMAAQTASPGQAPDKRVAIRKEVRHELLLLPQYSLFDWLEFEVQPDGNVVLSGQVRGYDLKSNAEIAVKGIAGVSSVVNKIDNLPLSPSDDEVRRKMYRAIYIEDGPLFHYALDAVPSIHIIVANGVVTLKGTVASQSDSDLAGIKASSIQGGLTVKNELRVEKR
jgi:hypothetical protein